MNGNGRTSWRVTGVHAGTCNCIWSCPCQFNALPDKGYCEAILAWQINDGHFGETSLDGVRFGLRTEAPGADLASLYAASRGAGFGGFRGSLERASFMGRGIVAERTAPHNARPTVAPAPHSSFFLHPSAFILDCVPLPIRR